jgi:hypothetical protein
LLQVAKTWVAGLAFAGHDTKGAIRRQQIRLFPDGA